jgi:NADH-quinone oxidoreductase subunit C
MDYHEMVDLLKERFPDAILGYQIFRGELTVDVDYQFLIPLCTFLKDEDPFKMDVLTDLAGLDYGKDASPRFGISYLLTSTENVFHMRVKIAFDESTAIESVTGIWKSADWLEREAWEMFGINFVNHPDLRKLLLPDDLEGHPMRKDFPTKGFHFEEPFRA